jgi:hypothetical protein
MKNAIKVILLFSLMLNSCHYQTKNNTDAYNGIDKRLLNIVDSLPLCDNGQNFVSISFTTDSFYNLTLEVYNDFFIPAPPEPPEPYRVVLLTNTDWFVGYKKYKDWYILFNQFGVNDKIPLFVEKDSLSRDEKPFIENGNDIYNYYSRKDFRTCKKFKLIFSIDDKDSLIFLQKKEILVD